MAITQDIIRGSYNAATGRVEGELPIQPYGRKLVQAALQGPTRSRWSLYRGEISSHNLLTTTLNGGGGNYDSVTGGMAPVYIPAGARAIGVWDQGATAVGSTGVASCYFEVVV